MSRSVSIVALMMLLSAVAGCDSFIDVGRDLDITVTTDRNTVPAGENVRISYSATGGFLTRITINFGDGGEEVRHTGGSQTASGNVLHSYAEPGTYTVKATALDGSGQSTGSETMVQVTEANP